MTTELAPPAPIEIDPDGGLFGRRSVLGGLLILALITFFSVGIQAIDNVARESSGFSAGEATEVTPGVTFVPAEGWVNDPEQTVAGVSVAANKNGWDVTISSGLVLDADNTLESWAGVYTDTDEPGAQASDPETFTTTSGVTGVHFEIHGTTSATLGWLVPNGSNAVLMLASGSAANLDSVEDDLDQMAASITTEGSAP